MPITTTCPGCARPIHAPDAAAGRKAKCPHCGVALDIPGPHAVTVMPAGHPAAPAATPVTPESTIEALEQAAERSAIFRANATPSSSRSSTLTDRVAWRTSPYQPLRLLATILFGVGIVFAVLLTLGGLTGLVVLAIRGNEWAGVGVFVGSLMAAIALVLGAKAVSELLRVWADVGDRMRQMTHMLDEWVNRPRNGSL